MQHGKLSTDSSLMFGKDARCTDRLINHRSQLADFGLTRVLNVEKKTHVSTQTYGTVAYMPPELLSSSRLTKAVRPVSYTMCDMSAERHIH